MGKVEIILHPGSFGPGPAKPNTSYISIIMRIQHPFLCGNIASRDCYPPRATQAGCLCHAQHLNTSDSLLPPAIDPNYLSKQIDQSILVGSVKFASRIAKTDRLATMLVA
ncbi:GMC oxidoreductase domain-containing protein [Rhizoctonia solani AG-1 IA]|uniref:GMC oxidoreductase domain-containing protein n=1 Tax=Thanatephorus cucumeris (strain AG1-IA) TaxID=983506 RepID=L8WKV7_THACA|nr:GMC oxidoreductase domain-containing protein [Rhizoctonia solani AG-1 IA]